VILWSAVLAGAAEDEAALREMRDRLAEVLADPRYGTGLHLLSAGSTAPVPVLAGRGSVHE
jgi:hypothetical protein